MQAMNTPNVLRNWLQAELVSPLRRPKSKGLAVMPSSPFPAVDTILADLDRMMGHDGEADAR